MNEKQFNELPLLLRRREAGWLEGMIGLRNWKSLLAAGSIGAVQVKARVAGAHGSAYYFQRATFAPLLGWSMDWRPFDGLPELLKWGDLKRLGLRSEDIPRLREAGRLTVYPGPAPTRFHKVALAVLVGRWTRGGREPRVEGRVLAPGR